MKYLKFLLPVIFFSNLALASDQLPPWLTDDNAKVRGFNEFITALAGQSYYKISGWSLDRGVIEGTKEEYVTITVKFDTPQIKGYSFISTTKASQCNLSGCNVINTLVAPEPGPNPTPDDPIDPIL